MNKVSADLCFAACITFSLVYESWPHLDSRNCGHGIAKRAKLRHDNINSSVN